MEIQKTWKFFRKIHSLNFANVGLCTGEAQTIPNAEVIDSGNLQSAMRYYVCSGDYMWSNLKLENQTIVCKEDGTWSNSISITCKRVFSST